VDKLKKANLMVGFFLNRLNRWEMPLVSKGIEKLRFFTRI